MLEVVALVERVCLRAARRPDRVTREGAASALRQPLDQRRRRDAIDHIVEAVVRPHPLVRQAPAVDALPWLGAQLLGGTAEHALGRFELLEIRLGELRGGELGRKRLELGADEKGLTE